MFDKDNKFGFINNNENSNNNVEGLDNIKTDINNVKNEVKKLDTQYKDIVNLKNTGWSSEQINLLCTILSECITGSDQIANVNNLKTLLLNSSNPGTSDYDVSLNNNILTINSVANISKSNSILSLS